MTSMHGGDVVIVGAAETELGTLPNVSMLELHGQAAVAAVRDAGLELSDIDGLATAGPLPMDVSHYLGVIPRWLDGTMVGGASFMMLVRHAAAAIAAGAATTILITHGESGRSRVGATPWSMSPMSMAGQFEHPYGAAAPYSTFTVPARAFLHERGMSARDLAEVVVAQREWAQPNPKAARRKPTTVDEVLGGDVIVDPFTKEMCCLVTDGGGALVMTSRERAVDLASADRMVYLLGSGESTDSPLVSQLEELGSAHAFRRSGLEAFQSAGLVHGDVGHLMFYDAFAHVPLYMLEDLGFVGHGESGEFVRDGNTRPGGRLPMNTNGGGLSYTHTGMYGMFAIQEAVRQLRGEAVYQVPNLSVSFVQGVGFYFTSSGSLVLSNTI